MTPPITYITREGMIHKWGQDYYGYTLTHVGIWIRSDLPTKVIKSVLAHEMKHWDDNAFQDGRVWYWEIRAWGAGFTASPLGSVQAIILSITNVERIKLYLTRITKNF